MIDKMFEIPIKSKWVMSWKHWVNYFSQEGIQVLDNDSGYSYDDTVDALSAKSGLLKCTVKGIRP